MRKRRHFTAEFKRQLVEQTCRPGNSISGLAQAHGINANQLHKWRRKILARAGNVPGAASTPDLRVSFNGRLRQECLNAHWFLSLEDARRKIDEWRQYYNETRPHSALQWATPAEFARQARENALFGRPKEPEFSILDRY